MTRLHDRLAALEAERAAAIRDPGPDADDFTRLTYQIQRTAASSGRPLTRQQAEAKARRWNATLAAMDAIEHGIAP